MPGFSAECAGGRHKLCAMAQADCRCQCHSEVKDWNPPPVTSLPNEPQSVCPKCQRKAPVHEVFCRADGARMVKGSPCPKCMAPIERNDMFCWKCGVRLIEPVKQSAQQSSEEVSVQ